MAKEQCLRLSTVTGKRYNVFDTVKILNLDQCIYYMQKDVFPVDIKISENHRERKCLVFYFNKEESKTVYDEWCNLGK